MNIRTFQAGDDEAQAAIYNLAAGQLPKFKPATAQDVARRAQAPDFDPTMRFFAIVGGRPVAYTQFSGNGRVGYPWCLKGHEDVAVPLARQMFQQMAKRGYQKANAAYRGDWPAVLDFFKQQGFAIVREMVGFVCDILDMPTARVKPHSGITPLDRGDVPALFALAPQVLGCASAAELEKHLFENPYFPASSVFVLRQRPGDSPVGAGLVIRNSKYADPKMVDAAMPCFRLGAFGSEGMTAKRINGMFSFLCRDDGSCGGIAVELLGHAACLVEDSDGITALAGQVPSDAPNLLRFYQTTFRRQGSFPVMERKL